MTQKLDTQSSNKLLNGTQIAFAISIMLHLLIYKYGFPQLKFHNKKTFVESTVATIELSPFEASRLPNLESQWEIPDFNNSSLDGIASPFAFPSYITPGDLSNLPPVPIPFPPNFNLPPFPLFPPISTDIELPPIGDFSALPLPPPLEDIESPTSPTPTPATEITTPPEKPPAPPVENKPTPEQIAAVRQQKLQGNIRDISSGLKKQEVGTTDEDARKNYLAWLTKVESIEPEAIEIEGIYPRDACIRRLEGNSVYGVVIDGDNTIVAMELIKSADYPIFNQQANQDIRNNNFENDTKQPKPYRVTVNYQYNAEICPSLTLPSLRKKTETPTPETKPNPAPAPETKPTAAPETKPTAAPETKPVPTPETKEETPLPSLRERLQNTPLLDNDSIRERLRNNPLPKKE